MEYSFITAAARHLSLVEINAWISNQHEFNGVSVLRRMFGDNKQCFQASFTYYDETGEVIREDGDLTWYDSRISQPKRSAEYRLYYSENNIVRKADVGDLLIVGKKVDNTLSIIIAKNGCQFYNYN